MPATQPLAIRRYDQLLVEIHPSADAAGRAAAERAAASLRWLIAQRGGARAAFATGTSQFPFVAALRKQTGIDWSRVEAFHLDEYLGMSADHPASFRRWLIERIQRPLRPGAFHFLQGDAPDAQAECARYAALLEANPIDIGFVGIGENGHIAFNDPPVADFDDPARVKVVTLDEACRRQQLGEGWFPTLDAVPTHALSLTVPAIMAFARIVSVVPEARKADAVRAALEGPLSTACPASILRTHPHAILFLDRDSAAQLSGLEL
ncbi:MAG TPA: glucosamine-6-phosphate deaminase [Limnochordia bacterium]